MKVKIRQEEIEKLSRKGIYRIYSDKTNKSYIGSTWKSFKGRWKQHLDKLNRNNHPSQKLQNDYNLYGTDSFTCEIIEVIESQEILLEREKYYIELYNSYKSGYNANPDLSLSPMMNEESRIKSSETHKKQWEELKQSMSPEEFEKYKKEYCEKTGFVKGREPWNKGIKMTEEQTKNMKKPKKNGVSQAMKEVHIKNGQRTRDRSDYIIVYDKENNWLNTFWCTADLVEYSKSEYNILPIDTSRSKTRALDNSKIANHIKDGKLYKGLYLKRAPKSRKLSYANAENSWKAESEPIMSQAGGTLSEGAETTGEVQSS